MKLRDLLARDDVPDVDVASLAIDSRRCEKAALFAAFPGSKVDGSAFIAQAIAAGAVAVIAPNGTKVDGAYHIVSDDPRALMAGVAARFYQQRPAQLFAITGTNGKTSTVDMIRQILTRLHVPAASIGTLGVMRNATRQDFGLTTPDVLTFHRTLAQLAGEGVQALAFEASSHALDQHRVAGIAVQVAGFSNLTRDHIDYHGSMEAYFAAKARIIDLLTPDGTLVINADDAYSAQLMALAQAKQRKAISIGTAGTDIRIVKRQILLQAQHLSLNIFGKNHELILPLVGGFQADNALMAAAMVIATGYTSNDVMDALSHIEPVLGRLEYIASSPAGAAIYVDYAHTPDGLRAALQALRPHTQKQLHVVFGCGGDRDRGKRPQMAAVAGDLADHVIITDDNPRTEDAASIRAEVQSGFPAAQMMGDRRAAMAQAVAQASSGDVILVAGKGHEEGQIVGSTILPFNDAAVVRALVQEEAA
jgi:UDP-N-acetylmuramoyl-L-alanyl-D-glutamate--2,6-diaminopimelate ligase